MSIYDDIEAARKRTYGKSYSPSSGSSGVSISSGGGDINSQIDAARKRAFATPSQQAATQQQVKQAVQKPNQSWFDAAVSAIKKTADTAISALKGQQPPPIQTTPTPKFNPNATPAPKTAVNNLPIDLSQPKQPASATTTVTPQSLAMQAKSLEASNKVFNAIDTFIAGVKDQAVQGMQDLSKGVVPSKNQVMPKIEYDPSKPDAYGKPSQSYEQAVKESKNPTIMDKINKDVGLSFAGVAQGLTFNRLKADQKQIKTKDEKIAYSIGTILAQAGVLKLIAGRLAGFATGSESIGNFVNSVPKVGKYIVPLASNIGAFDIYGQLEPDIKNRFQKLAEDTATGTLFTVTGGIKNPVVSIPANFALGYGLAKAGGASNEDAFISGGILAVLDTYGKGKGALIKSNFKSGELTMTPDQLKNQANATNFNGTPAQDVLNKAAAEAEAKGMNIKIHLDVAQRSKGAKIFNAKTPQGFSFSLELVPKTEITLLKEEGVSQSDVANKVSTTEQNITEQNQAIVANAPQTTPPELTSEKQFMANAPVTTPEVAPAPKPAEVTPAPAAAPSEPVTVKTTDELLTYIDRQGQRTPEQISALKADIIKNGIKYPVELISNPDGTFEINDGTHRIQIANDLGIKEIPVKIVGENKPTAKVSNEPIVNEIAPEKVPPDFKPIEAKTEITDTSGSKFTEFKSIADVKPGDSIHAGFRGHIVVQSVDSSGKIIAVSSSPIGGNRLIELNLAGLNSLIKDQNEIATRELAQREQNKKDWKKQTTFNVTAKQQAQIKKKPALTLSQQLDIPNGQNFPAERPTLMGEGELSNYYKGQKVEYKGKTYTLVDAIGGLKKLHDVYYKIKDKSGKIITVGGIGASGDVRPVNQPALEPTEKPRKSAPKPEPKPVQRVSSQQKMMNNFEAAYKEAKKMTGKTLDKLTRADIEEHFSVSKFAQGEGDFPLNDTTQVIYKKLGSPAKVFSSDTLDTRPVLKFGGVNKGVFTDGFVLVQDKTAAKEINQEIIDKEKKALIKSMQQTAGTELTFSEAEKLADKSIQESIANSEESYPVIDKVIPDTWNKEVAEVKGFQVNQYGINFAFLSDGKDVAAANPNFLAFMDKYLPDATVHLTGSLSPIVYVKDNKVVGLVMPVRVQDESNYFMKNAEPQGASGDAKKGQFADLPVLTDNTFTLKSIAFPEMVRLARELTGKVPEIKRQSAMRGALGRAYSKDLKIKLSADIFKDPTEAAKVLAHELGHIADYLPDHTGSRRNLVGRIATLNKHLKDAYGELSNKVIREELINLSNKWSPFDPANKKSNYTKYRTKPSELYADAISVLYNDPMRVKQEAPNFYKGWFEYLDRKPTVKENFFAIQDLLNSSDEQIFRKRNEELTNAYAKGEEAWAAKILDNQNRKTNVFHALRTMFDDRNYELNRRVTEQMKQGVKIEDRVNPMLDYEGLNYLDGTIKTFVGENFQPAYEMANQVPNGWDELGKILQMERVLGDRSEFANPGGYSPKEAQQFLDGLKSSMSESDWTTLQQAKEMFREANNKVVALAKEEGYYLKDLKTSDAYATFAVIDYLDTYISPAIKQQVGTLKDVANPATATLMKAVSTLRAVQVNSAKRNAIDFTLQRYSGDIEPAKTTFNGKYQQVLDPKDNSQGKVIVIRDGKVEGYYVEKGLANVFNRTSSDVINMAAQLSRKLTLSPVYRPLFTSVNLGFQTFNFVRDFKRYWKNIPDRTLGQAITSLPRALWRYGQAAPHAARDVMGRKDQLISDMENLKILGLTYNDMFYNPDRTDEKMVERVLQKAGILEAPRHRRLTTPFFNTVSALETFGNFIERLPKVAAYIELKDQMPEKELGKFIRNYVGSPNFRTQGSATPVSNNILMFSNAIKEGIKSDFTIASGRYEGKYKRQSQAGFWWKTVISDFLPKLIMAGMVAGFFGDKLKKMMANVSEYDKTNYTIIPITMQGDKTVYLRVPSDETGRFLGAILWKSLSISQTKDLAGLFQIFAVGAGQFPNLVPSITGVGVLMDYMSGKNPYDSFRGRNIVPDTEFQAGVKYSFPYVLNYMIQNQGLGIIAPSYTPGGDISNLEKFVTAPILSNIVGRWLKVSNYGQTEQNKEITAKIQSKQAQNTLQNRDTLDKYIQEYQKAPSIANKYRLQAQYVKDAVGSPAGNPNYKRDRTNAIKKFNIAVARGQNDPDINSFLSATSNDEKAQILKKIRQNRGESEVKSIISELRKQKLYSAALNTAYLKAIK